MRLEILSRIEEEENYIRTINQSKKLKKIRTFKGFAEGRSK